MRGLLFSVIQPYASHYRQDGHSHICGEDAAAPCVANQHYGRDEPKQDGGADDEFQDFHIASLVQPRNLQHFAQYPSSRYISFVVSLFRQCLHSVGSRWASLLITLIFLSVLIRQRRIDFLLAGLTQHFRMPFLQRHIPTAVEALWFHITPPPLAAEPADVDNGRPCRTVSPPHRSGIRTRPGRFACQASA